ncbi:hypothetical protein BDK51DRAFT_32853 [Blyttiomyces helicus]|uniref:Uncharacterized protein n=1 Tax=Blyttiomyces helicus TaxID=388810 RepID=A0A4P9W4J2_9FUNG|nr:hypothetical protein BDK51DRAFT_32853 [Blyttiomyces helicus]|eukprot:RKO85096.1 hypothetical protein BDK51DRAFT_32853 [Blyttiomyces helicus]
MSTLSAQTPSAEPAPLSSSLSDALASPFSLKTRQAVAEIAGTETEVVVTEFADKIFILVTQFGKMGNLLLATLDNPPTSLTEKDAPPPSVSTRTLLGERDDPLAQVYASHILSRMAAETGEARPLLLGLALRREDDGVLTRNMEVFDGVLALLKEANVLAA